MFSNPKIQTSKNGKDFQIIISELDVTSGITLKNIIRRTAIVFSSSYKVFSFRIEGIEHELKNIDGVLESTIDICEKLQKIYFVSKKNDVEYFTFYLNKEKQGEIKSKDFICDDESIEILNKDLTIFKKVTDQEIKFSFLVKQDVGFISRNNLPITEGYINLDTDFSFIDNINIELEEYFTSFENKKEKLIINFVSSNANAIDNFFNVIRSFSDLLHNISLGDNTLVKDLNISEELKLYLFEFNIVKINDLNNVKKTEILKNASDALKKELKGLMKERSISFKS